MKNTDSYLLLTSLRVYFLKAGCFGIMPGINGKTTSLLCHCVPPQRKRLSSNQQKDNTHEIGRTRPVVFIGDEKRKG